MTEQTLNLYTQKKVYYNLAEVDNPDQRIAQDVASFTGFSLALGITLITSVVDLASFSYILYSIYPALLYVILGYAAFGTLASVKIGADLVPLNFEGLKREADFRFSLVRLRENREGVAFYNDEGAEGRNIGGRFGDLIDNAKKIVDKTRGEKWQGAN